MTTSQMIRTFFLISLVFTSLFAQTDFRTAMLYKADISANKAYELQQKGILLIDTRTRKEYQTLHAKGAINIPVFNEQKGQRIFNKNFLNEIYAALKENLHEEVILICRSGSRTKLASNLLAHNHFTNVYNVKYGFQYDWIKQNLPVER